MTREELMNCVGEDTIVWYLPKSSFFDGLPKYARVRGVTNPTDEVILSTGDVWPAVDVYPDEKTALAHLAANFENDMAAAAHYLKQIKTRLEQLETT